MLHVFYDSMQVVDQPGHTSPSAGKPKLVLEEWERIGIPLELHPIEPVTEAQLKLAHDPKFVDGILSTRLENGFGNKSEAVAASLPYTSGSMLSAAKWVLEKGRVACSPTSGFHHAGYTKAEGFCTFNGLMVTALALKEAGRVNRVGVLDLDHHYGNGTDDICYRLKIDWLTHYTIGLEHLHFKKQCPQSDPGVTQADSFIKRLPSIVRRYLDCDLVLYQAGADLWEGDPFAWEGGLSVDQLKTRDEIVFRELYELGIPVVWNLAGGYKRDKDGTIQPVLDIHNNTARASVQYSP